MIQTDLDFRILIAESLVKRGTFFENLVVSICYIPPSHQAILTKFAPEVAQDPKSDLRKVTPKGVKWGLKGVKMGSWGSNLI